MKIKPFSVVLLPSQDGVRPLRGLVTIDGVELRHVRRVTVTHDASDVTEVTVTFIARVEYDDDAEVPKP